MNAEANRRVLMSNAGLDKLTLKLISSLFISFIISYLPPPPPTHTAIFIAFRYVNSKKTALFDACLLITLCGGLGRGHIQLWKIEIQCYADEMIAIISVYRLPLIKIKRSKFENRAFYSILQNWSDQSYISNHTVVNLIVVTKISNVLVSRSGLGP